MSTACPKCGSRYVRPSRTRDFSEQLGVLRNHSPFRCRDCKERFFAPTFVWRDLFYARCPTCQRMDLNGWTGKTYTPPFWVGVKVTLGAHKFRCEYCRYNFAAFRKRKEAFTFKRWKAYGNSAEDYSRGENPGTQASGAAAGADSSSKMPIPPPGA